MEETLKQKLKQVNTVLNQVLTELNAKIEPSDMSGMADSMNDSVALLEATNTKLQSVIDILSGTNIYSSSIVTDGSASPITGAKSVSFEITGTGTTIQGVTEDDGAILELKAEVGKTLENISYNVTSGSLKIRKIV